MSLMITSTANPRVKALAALSQPRERRLSGLCLVEGHDEIELAHSHGAVIDSVWLCPDLMRASDLVLAERLRASGLESVEVSESVMAKLAYREHPDAWLAVVHTPDTDLFTLAARIKMRNPAATHPPSILVLDSIEKPGNIGAVLRSADAAGITGVIASDCRTDMGNPNIVRASRGTVFTLPIAECRADEAIDWLTDQGFALYAASPEGSMDHWSLDFSAAGGTAVAFGAEREGLSEYWFTKSIARVRIPMEGVVNSLNIAQSATLVAYEALRQRQRREKTS